MRASLLFVGPLLARFGTATLDEVGGCNIGERNTDLHYPGFARMGAIVEGTPTGGYRLYSRNGGMHAANMYCDLPSHTGTENLIMAASLTAGESVIVNAASDPEIADFVVLLKKMGAKVEGVGSRHVVITGVDKLHGAEHTVMYDRLDAGLFMMGAAITQGDVRIQGVIADDLELFEQKLEQMGVDIEHLGDDSPVLTLSGLP